MISWRFSPPLTELALQADSETKLHTWTPAHRKLDTGNWLLWYLWNSTGLAIVSLHLNRKTFHKQKHTQTNEQLYTDIEHWVQIITHHIIFLDLSCQSQASAVENMSVSMKSGNTTCLRATTSLWNVWNWRWFGFDHSHNMWPDLAGLDLDVSGRAQSLARVIAICFDCLVLHVKKIHNDSEWKKKQGKIASRKKEQQKARR